MVIPLCSAGKTGMNKGSLHVARRVQQQALHLRMSTVTHAGYTTRPSAANLQLLTACRVAMQAALQTVSNPSSKGLDDLPTARTDFQVDLPSTFGSQELRLSRAASKRAASLFTALKSETAR
ncbi:hypothetical protein PUN4_760022 [Paraburkholderia unamae]|nr:hypothetical protein PUN4_760022 [Paraburkholderia unamae]